MEKTTIRPRENIFVIKAEELYIAFDPEEGGKWELNETGAFILKHFIEGTSIEETRDRVVEEFGLEPGKAGEAIQEFIEDLRGKGIIE
ncbi:MAG: PqqD family protein [Theionarchaea archaeon]|nr:PqqD family protein [Theionarchaea archaeon]